MVGSLMRSQPDAPQVREIAKSTQAYLDCRKQEFNYKSEGEILAL